MTPATVPQLNSIKRYRERMKAQGLCTQGCRRPLAEKSSIHCVECRNKNRERCRKYHKRRKQR